MYTNNTQEILNCSYCPWFQINIVLLMLQRNLSTFMMFVQRRISLPILERTWDWVGSHDRVSYRNYTVRVHRGKHVDVSCWWWPWLGAWRRICSQLHLNIRQAAFHFQLRGKWAIIHSCSVFRRASLRLCSRKISLLQYFQDWKSKHVSWLLIRPLICLLENGPQNWWTWFEPSILKCSVCTN
jgi:hypothetical protein